MKKLGLLLMTLLFFVGNLSTLRAATNYPVQLTAQVLPPYGTCLSDYVVDGMERINITALQRDLTKGIYQVEVRMQVKQATKLLLTASAKYNLQAGIITKLPASNLFSALSDVQGSTKFKDNGYCFPEGAYEFVFQAFDARNNKLPVSEPAYFFAFLQKAQPPYCLFPADNACVDYTSQVINLVWTEPTVSIPSNGKRYAVEIYEMPDGFDAVRDNAESIASSLPPVYQKDDLNNAVTMHQVFQSAGLFIKGRSYAWRVRTYSVRNRMLESGSEKYNTSDYVENNGYSKFSTFHFKKCVDQGDLWKKEEKKMTFDLSLKPKIEKVDTAGSKAVVIWERDEEKFPCGYEVEWNLVDTLAAPWGRVKVPANDDRFELKGVKKGVEYVTRVRGLICPKEGSTDTIRTAYSDTLHFLLKRAESSACAHPVPANTSTVSLKEPLTNGSWMTANGHDIKVLTCEMNTAGGDTTFTGTGLVSYGFLTNLVSLTVKFDKVKINEQRELLRGMVYCNTDKDNCLDFNLNNIANKKSTGDPAQMQETNLPVYNSKSDIPNGTVGIVDGTVLAKDEDGKTKEIGKEEKEEPASCAPKTSCIDDQEAYVSFSPQSDWNPPFDKEQGIFTKSLSIGDYYEKIEKYTTPWVAVPAGATATVVANLNLTSGSSVKPEHVYFICRTKGQTLKLKAEKDGDNRFYVPVFGGEEGRFVEVVAMADTSKGGDAACSQLFTLGRAKVLSMKKEELTLHIVPFRREANTVKEETIEKKLNDIYQPLGKTFKVVVEERFGDGEEYDFVEDGLTVEGSGVMETETAEMSMLKVLYNEERGFSKEENQAYLFLLPKSATAGVLGDMPRNKPVGYVFADPSTTYADGHTVAHEIGHGIFTFDHAFEYYQGNQGQTDNLMDYKEGTNNDNLKVWQWSVMDTHKNYVLPFLEGDEDAMAKRGSELVTDILYKLKCAIISNANKIFVATSGNVRTIEGLFGKYFVTVLLPHDNSAFTTDKVYDSYDISTEKNMYYDALGNVIYDFGSIKVRFCNKNNYKDYFETFFYGRFGFIQEISDIRKLIKDGEKGVLDLLCNFPLCVYEELSFDERMFVLGLLVEKSESYTERLSENYEEMVLNILRVEVGQKNKTNIEKMIKYFFENTNCKEKCHVFNELSSGMDNWWGKANYDEYILLLTKLFNEYYGLDEYNKEYITENVSESGLMIVEFDYWFNWNFNHASWTTMLHIGDIKLNSNCFYSLPYNEQESEGFPNSGPLDDVSPISLISVYFAEERNFMHGDLTLVDKRVVMPAFTLVYLLNQEKDANLSKYWGYVFEALGIIMGATEVYAGYKLYRAGRAMIPVIEKACEKKFVNTYAKRLLDPTKTIGYFVEKLKTTTNTKELARIKEKLDLLIKYRDRNTQVTTAVFQMVSGVTTICYEVVDGVFGDEKITQYLIKEGKISQETVNAWAYVHASEMSKSNFQTATDIMRLFTNASIAQKIKIVSKAITQVADDYNEVMGQYISKEQLEDLKIAIGIIEAAANANLEDVTVY